MTSKAWVALWTVYIIWGSTYLAIAVAVETIHPMFAVSTRFILAGAIMALVVRFRGGTMRVRWRELGSCAVIGILLPGANAAAFLRRGRRSDRARIAPDRVGAALGRLVAADRP